MVPVFCIIHLKKDCVFLQTVKSHTKLSPVRHYAHSHCTGSRSFFEHGETPQNINILYVPQNIMRYIKLLRLMELFFQVNDKT